VWLAKHAVCVFRVQWSGLSAAGFSGIVARLFRGGGLDDATSKSPPLKRRATARTNPHRLKLVLLKSHAKDKELAPTVNSEKLCLRYTWSMKVTE
jgi:hypothetical protein